VLFLAGRGVRVNRKEGEGEMNFRNQSGGGSRQERRPLVGVLPVLFALVLLTTRVSGGDDEETPSPVPDPIKRAEEPATLWDRTTLIRNAPDAPLGSLALTGRLHYDYVNLDANVGEAEIAAFRRARTGFRARLFGQWELNGEVDLDLNEASPLYVNMANAYLQWRPTDRWTFRAGKQPVFFTLEGSTNSNELLTLERSNLTTNFWFVPPFIPGLSADHIVKDYHFTAGLFSGGSASPEFGDFDGSVFGVFKAGRDFAKELDAAEGVLALHWVVQDPDPNNTFTRPHEHISSVNFRFKKGPWGWQGDLARSLGAFDQSDLTGLVLMPYLDLDKQWQLVARATFLESDEPDGIRPGRYESRLSTERGDHFQDFYAGLNRYLRGHQLKWQSGVSYTRLDDSEDDSGDYAGWSYSSGIRLSW
jgi:phosphate-selective porin OprO and OprP